MAIVPGGVQTTSGTGTQGSRAEERRVQGAVSTIERMRGRAREIAPDAAGSTGIAISILKVKEPLPAEYEMLKAGADSLHLSPPRRIGGPYPQPA